MEAVKGMKVTAHLILKFRNFARSSRNTMSLELTEEQHLIYGWDILESIGGVELKLEILIILGHKDCT